MKLISFSIYGSSPKYLQGALENSKAAKEWYPSWSTRFYVSEKLPPDYIEELRNTAGEVIPVDEQSHPQRNVLEIFSNPRRQG